MRAENACSICGCEDNKDFDCLAPCPCKTSTSVVRPGCAAMCKEGGMPKVYSKQTMVPCNICDEQCLVTNGETADKSPKILDKLTDKRPIKLTQHGRGVKRSCSSATNGGVEKIEEECDSPQQQEVPFFGRRFNDAAATVPIKKRRIQIVEVVRSPSPPLRSPVKVVHSLSPPPRSSTPVSEHVLPPRSLVLSEHVGDVLCNDSSIEIVSSGEPTEEHIDAPSLHSELASTRRNENAALGNEAQADIISWDQLRAPQEETEHATELGLVVSSSVVGNVAEPIDFRADMADLLAEKAESQIEDAVGKGGVLLRLPTEESQKVEFPVNDNDDKAAVLLGVTAGESAQNVGFPVDDANDRGMLMRLNSGYGRDGRLHWDLNMEMEAWEQANNEKLGADNLPDIKDNASDTDGSSCRQALSVKNKANSENTLEEVNSENDNGVFFDGQSGERDYVETAYVTESFEYDAYDEEDELISDSDKHARECAKEDKDQNRQHGNLNDWVKDVGEELEAEEHVDYGDSDCRDADDMGLEGDERLSLALQAESDWKGEEPTGNVEPRVIDEQVPMEVETGLERGEKEADSHTQRDSHDTRSNEMKEEDRELLSQSDGSKMHDSDDNLVDLREGQESAEREGGGGEGQQPESEGERVLQISESNSGGKDVSGKSGLQREADNQPGPTCDSRLQKHPPPCRKKSTGWDQLPEGCDSVEDALRAVKERSTCRGGGATWSVSNIRGSFISARGASSSGRSVIRGISSRVDGNFRDRGRSHDLIRSRENNSNHSRLEGGFDTGSRFTSSRETVRGRNLGRGSGAGHPGRLRVERWMDAPDGHWGPGRRRSPGRYALSVGLSSRVPTNNAALAAAKVQSSGFVVAPDGTIIKAGSAGSAGRGGVHTLGVGRGCGISMNAGRGPLMDADADMNFRMRMNMPSHRSAGPMSKLMRRTPPLTSKWSGDKREEDRSRDRDCKRPVSRVHTPLRRTSPRVVHGSALMDERDREVLAVTRQISPARSKQSEQTGESPSEFIGRFMEGNSDTRHFNREHDDTGRFTGSDLRSSLKAGSDRDRPSSSSQRERSREEERRREKFVSRDGRHISGYKHTSTRDVDDDVAPRRRRVS